MIDIPGVFLPSPYFFSFGQQWLACPRPALLHTQLESGQQHKRSGSAAVPTQSQLPTWYSSLRCSCANSAVGRERAESGPLNPGKEAQNTASSGGGWEAVQTDRQVQTLNTKANSSQSASPRNSGLHQKPALPGTRDCCPPHPLLSSVQPQTSEPPTSLDGVLETKHCRLIKISRLCACMSVYVHVHTWYF